MMASVLGANGPSLLRGGGTASTRNRRRCVHVAAQAVEMAEKPTVVAVKEEGSGELIYIGFEKGDYAPRTGRKGRFITADPSQYPDRTPLTGGWPGGEAGLKAWVEEYAEKSDPAKPVLVELKTQPPASKVVKAFGEPIYLGFSKDELEARKAGLRGRVIKDDPQRYPDKETIGPFINVVGGFPGGERGLKIFVEEGDFLIADPQQARKQFSPLIVAAIVSVGVTGAAILLNSLGTYGEQALGSAPASLLGSAPLPTVPTDATSTTLLYVALGLAALSATVAGGRAVVLKVQQGTEQAVESTVNLGKVAIFWIAVAVAAKLIIDS